MPDSYSGLQLANGRVRLASWRLPYSEPKILANRRDQIPNPAQAIPVAKVVIDQRIARAKVTLCRWSSSWMVKIKMGQSSKERRKRCSLYPAISRGQKCQRLLRQPEWFQCAGPRHVVDEDFLGGIISGRLFSLQNSWAHWQWFQALRNVGVSREDLVNHGRSRYRFDSRYKTQREEGKTE